MPTNQMTKSDAARIQSNEAKKGGDMSSGGFAARAQHGAAMNEQANPSGNNQGQSGQGQSGGNPQKK
ncbi:hypothetical protein XA68_14972 [Ophiocordyceps unilateralis]|uniref:SMP domain-containing protein n=1 Tax=Ophiocordyceps unilateralis TaxID=268505 RepID=A0A2A9PML0_OPHUN|nr:hypothetical protein XA68_14972 [Ophiocordyceps unilateralis]